MKFCLLFLALASPFAAVASPTFVVGTVTASTATTGLALLGLAKLGTAFALALGQSAGRRGKRSSNIIEDIDATVWKSVAKEEDSACLRRFICEVATGGLEAPEYIEMVKSLLAIETSQESDKPKIPFVEAAQSGATHHNVAKCQEKFDCKATGAQMYSLYALVGA